MMHVFFVFVLFATHHLINALNLGSQHHLTANDPVPLDQMLMETTSNANLFADEKISCGKFYKYCMEGYTDKPTLLKDHHHPYVYNMRFAPGYTEEQEPMQVAFLKDSQLPYKFRLYACEVAYDACKKEKESLKSDHSRTMADCLMIQNLCLNGVRQMKPEEFNTPDILSGTRIDNRFPEEKDSCAKCEEKCGHFDTVQKIRSTCWPQMFEAASACRVPNHTGHTYVGPDPDWLPTIAMADKDCLTKEDDGDQKKSYRSSGKLVIDPKYKTTHTIRKQRTQRASLKNPQGANLKTPQGTSPKTPQQKATPTVTERVPKADTAEEEGEGGVEKAVMEDIKDFEEDRAKIIELEKRKQELEAALKKQDAAKEKELPEKAPQPKQELQIEEPQEPQSPDAEEVKPEKVVHFPHIKTQPGGGPLQDRIGIGGAVTKTVEDSRVGRNILKGGMKGILK